jgi:hypothetical protein
VKQAATASSFITGSEALALGEVIDDEKLPVQDQTSLKRRQAGGD